VWLLPFLSPFTESLACLQPTSVLQEYGYYSGDDLWGYDDYYDEYYDYYDDVDTVKDCTVDKDGKVKLANGTGESAQLGNSSSSPRPLHGCKLHQRYIMGDCWVQL
jgi:hypothetical protein